ncbi:MAG: CoA pyrophosphatase [Deltaproteobacteria bacterium]|nr:CoA pyrophosphatase [Deltaproteobacteria bacterium]
MKDLPKIIRSVLADRTPVAFEDGDGGYRRSAVLIPLFESGGEYRLLFTKRTTRVEAHKGQISFPGGRVDWEDGSPEETALREAEEEIGLRREDVTMLGRIDDAVTLVSNYLVHPFVGLIPHPYNFRINPGEVDRILEVPFQIFLPEKGVGKVLPIQYEGNTVQSWAYTYDGDVIWGATARMMKNFIEILGEAVKGTE